MTKLLALLFFIFSLQAARSQDAKPPVNFAIFGLTHDHAYGFIPLTRGRTDAQLVGIVEPDQELAARYAKRFHLDKSLFYPDLDSLLAKTNIQAVAIFTSTFDHERVVKLCAAKHLDVMMEKPLAVSLAAGRAIADAAKKNNIQVVVNYETTWYPGNQTAHQIVTTDHAIGDLRKMIACDGHPGPVEIGCSKTFLSWLTDPKLNGGGALRDFGCYGADLFTWLMGDQRPTSVTAVTQHIKPAIYPRVEDEGTIIVTYPKAQGIIQASWNWPYSRKDLQIYGTSGYVLVPDKETLRIREGNGAESERKLSNSDLAGSLPDQLSYLVAVVRGEIQPSGLSGLRDNLIVTEILDAARKSARTGKRVDLPKKSPY